MSQRTQWTVVLASFFAINGVLATVFLSVVTDSTGNESALNARGAVSAEAGTTPPTVAAFVATPDTSSPAPDDPAAGLSPSTTAVPASTEATASDDQTNSADAVPSDDASSDDITGADASGEAVAAERGGTNTNVANDGSTDAGPGPEDSGEIDPVVEDVSDDSAELESESVTTALDAATPTSVPAQESAVDSSDLDPATDAEEAVEPDPEPEAKPVSSSFAAPESEGSTPVAHAEVSRIAARGGPSADSPVLATFTNPTPRGGELVFQATGLSSTTGAIGVDEQEWIEVLLPIRPNGTKGWIKRSQVKLTVNPYRIDIDLSRHELVVYRNGEQRLSTAISVGKGGTPTPVGGFFLTELLRPSDPSGAYGPYAYGLSGYSDTLTSFNGGPGVIGIHGTNRPSLLGTDVSHGCIRVANPVITKMAEFLPLGTPVKIQQ